MVVIHSVLPTKVALGNGNSWSKCGPNAVENGKNSQLTSTTQPIETIRNLLKQLSIRRDSKSDTGDSVGVQVPSPVFVLLLRKLGCAKICVTAKGFAPETSALPRKSFHLVLGHAPRMRRAIPQRFPPPPFITSGHVKKRPESEIPARLGLGSALKRGTLHLSDPASTGFGTASKKCA
jgi:hypothetical protein